MPTDDATTWYVEKLSSAFSLLTGPHGAAIFSKLKSACYGLLIGFIGQSISFRLALVKSFSSIWIPGAILMALLLSRKRDTWAAVTAGVIIGCVPPLMRYGVSFYSALAMFSVACAAVCAVAFFLSSESSIFSSFRTFCRYFLFAVILLSMFNGGIAAWTAYSVGKRPDVFHSWIKLAPGQAMGYLLITPFLLAVSSHKKPFPMRYSPPALEAILQCLGLLIMSIGLWLLIPPTSSLFLLLLLLAPVPLLLLAALRFGSLGASVAMLLIVTPTAWWTIYRYGLSNNETGQVKVHVLQLWVLSMGLLVHTLAIQSQQQGLIQNELSASLSQIGSLTSRLLQSQENERVRVSRELHDGVNQQMALLCLRISAMKRSGAVDLPKDLDALQHQAFLVTEDIRRISHHLHPYALQHLGLVPALHSLVDELSQCWKGKIYFENSYSGENLPHDISTCLYRIAQEAIGNSIKHSGAENILLRLGREDGYYLLAIEDDGNGFSPTEIKRGMGLVSMKERAKLLRGDLFIESEKGKGSLLHTRIPSPYDRYM